LNCFDDVLVACAAAQIAFEAVTDFGFGGIGVTIQNLFGNHHHSRCAEAALGSVLVPKGFLDAVKFVSDGEALNGGDACAVALNGEDGAGFDGFTVEFDGAGSAERSFAADVRAGQAEHLTEIVNEEEARLDGVGMWGSVYSDSHGHGDH
jgi:hypothetical protein